MFHLCYTVWMILHRPIITLFVFTVVLTGVAVFAGADVAYAPLAPVASTTVTIPVEVTTPSEPLPTTTTTTAPPATTTTTHYHPEPEPEPVEVAAVSAVDGDPSDPATWDTLAACETGGDWATNTGNGYYGGIQFALSSWEMVGGTGYPHEHSRETQIAKGQQLYDLMGGWSPWPGCTAKLGWR